MASGGLLTQAGVSGQESDRTCVGPVWPRRWPLCICRGSSEMRVWWPSSSTGSQKAQADRPALRISAQAHRQGPSDHGQVHSGLSCGGKPDRTDHPVLELSRRDGTRFTI